MAGAPLPIYYDFNSPYGYIGAHLITDLAARHGRTVDWHPTLLGAIFKVTGSGPLPNVPLKGEYSKRDFARSAGMYGLPYAMPAEHPFSPVAASRAVIWAKGEGGEDAARRMTLALYDAVWADGKSIAGAEATADVAAAAGFDRDAVLAGVNDGDVKAALMADVEDAISKGVFGSPFVLVDGEPFWGVDRFTMIEKWLKTGGW
ncbi:MAG: 2-hydroxychromene-2-carboxylate isomerase [Alphaproteobacteria bacterium]|jgi:2-hydroxychromene-2-carboxylate isomerase